MKNLKRVLVASYIIALSAPAVAGAGTPPAAAARAVPASSRTASGVPEKATAGEAQSYAARESSSKELGEFEGGSVVYIAFPVVAVVLACVLILVLL